MPADRATLSGMTTAEQDANVQAEVHALADEVERGQAEAAASAIDEPTVTLPVVDLQADDKT